MPLRIVSGWMFFSAFHRRVLLDADKLSPSEPGYIGEKFNQFMPGSIMGVGEMIEVLLDHPSALHAFLWTFTVIEALVGLALILGVATRLSALGMLLLSAGILFGAGWLGPTCLDEWQIGSVGIASGAAMMLGGPGPLALDSWLSQKFPTLKRRRWFHVVALPAEPPRKRATVFLATVAVLLTLVTNQVFHGGLWGPLRNDSVRPRVDVLSAAVTPAGDLQLELERPVGPETYGAFVVSVRVLDEHERHVRTYDAAHLATLAADAVRNRWLMKVRSGPHGLVVPLGARATVLLPAVADATNLSPGKMYVVELEDVSGQTWHREMQLDASP